MNETILASFRINPDLWQQFQYYARGNGTTATALLIAYIKTIVDAKKDIVEEQLEDEIKRVVRELNYDLMSEIEGLKSRLKRLDSTTEADIKRIERNCQIGEMLQIQDILNGQIYDARHIDHYVLDKLIEHRTYLEAELEIKLFLSNPKFILREFNKVLQAMGYKQNIENSYSYRASLK